MIVQIDAREQRFADKARHSRPPKEDGSSDEPKQATRRLNSPPLRKPRTKMAFHFSDSEEEEEEDDFIPTTQDLAKSFLDVEPQKEKEELEAAISTQSQRLSDSSMSTADSTTDCEVGTGTELSLPGFLAGFLKGIKDRLEVKIQDVEFRLSLDFPEHDKPEDSPAESTPATISLRVKQLSIEGITADGTRQASESPRDNPVRSRSSSRSQVGRRRVHLDDISAYLISEAPLFERIAKTSRSPSITGRPSKKRASSSETDTPAGGFSIPLSPTSSTKANSFDSGSTAPERYLGSDVAGGGLTASITTADGDRFADPVDDDEPRTPVASSPTTSRTIFPLASSDQASESVLTRSNVEESQTNEIWEPHDYDGRSAHQYSVSATRMLESGMDMNDGQLYQSSLPGKPGSLNTSDLISFEDGNSTASGEIDNIIHSSQPLAQSGRVFETGHLYGHLPDDSVSRSKLFLNPSNVNADNDGSGRTTPNSEGMSESKIYTHEEAESMYMSAMTAASAQSAQEFHLPGAWDSYSEPEEKLKLRPNPAAQDTIRYQAPAATEISESERCETPKPRATSTEHHEPETKFSSNLLDLEDDSQSKVHDPSESLIDSTHPSNTAVEADNAVAKQFLAVKAISLWSPELGEQSPTGEITRSPEPSGYHQVPGTFSEYAENGDSRRRRLSVIHRPPEASPSPIQHEESRTDELELAITDIELNGDIGTIQLFSEIIQLLLATIRSGSSPAEARREKDTTQPPSTVRMRFSVQSLSTFLVEHLQAVSSPTFQQDGMRFGSVQQNDDSNVLFKCCLERLQGSFEVSPKSMAVEAGLSHFSLGYADEDILSFDDSARLRTTVRDLREPQLDAISIAFSNADRATTVKVGTLPINVNFDLQKLDDALTSFGGVSGVLELSSSIVSNSTVLADSTSPKRARGVHFESPPPKSEVEPSRTTKLNVRFGGALLTVRGKSSGVTFQSSAIKILFRPRQGLVGLSIDEIRLSGPHPFNVDEDPPALVQLTNTRIDFLFTPKDDDLERLLSLLTPSRDKYENDDDILIDTLLRQRRKGSVLRISVGKAHIKVDDLESLRALSKLGDEMAKLSTVAKYLPDDDRPGILILCKVEEFDVKATVNDLIGTLTTNAQSLQLAYVGLPSLFAVEIGTIQVGRNQEEQLAHPVLDLSPPEQLPMIMARFLGGEVEPTVKVKFFNLCLEYRVSTIMAVLGLKEAMTPDDLAADLAASMATITGTGTRNLSPQSTKNGDPLGQFSKPLHLDVLLRDCVLGLNPRNMSSKILVVLTDTKLLSNLPGKENIKSTVEVRKASMLITDQERSPSLSNEHVSKRPGSAGLGSRQVTELGKRGYVSISYISAAQAHLRILDNPDGSKTADIELRDDLFVLETCADSTQTLFATLNSLKPPMPPSRDIKHRTEVMPMEEMLASFTGNAFAPSWDHSTEQADLLGLEEGDLLDDEELPTNLEYVGSFYNPDRGLTEEDFGDDMLDENIEQIASPRPVRDGQPLLESFQEQYEVGSDNGPLDFEEDYFGTGSEVKGHARKWNSVKNQLGTANEFKIRGSPLKVRARDVHIIWNLFDGYDWQSTRDVITKTVKDVEHRAEERRSRRRRSANVEEEDEESVIGDFLFNSIYIGIPASRDPKELTRHINRNVDDLITESESVATATTTTATAMSRSPSRGQSTFSRRRKLKVHRSKQHKITFELKSVSIDMIVFPADSDETQSSIDIRVKEFEIFDHVPTSTWKKFATYLYDAGEPEMGKPMIRLEILTVKPVAELAASELVVTVSSGNTSELKHTYIC